MRSAVRLESCGGNMASIVSGNGLGLSNSSQSVLRGYGPRSDVASGATADRLYLNAASGNVVVQRQDEYLASLGLDLAVVRTYNSQGLLNDDNGDNWRLGVYRSLSAP